MGDAGFTKEEREETSAAYNKSVWFNVFRSKGILYVASQTDTIFTWQTSGIVNEVKTLGKWLASGDKEELYEKGHQEDYDSWKDKVQGDRKSEIVIIGSGIDREGVIKALDECLISEEEYKKMKKADKIVPYEVPEGEED